MNASNTAEHAEREAGGCGGLWHRGGSAHSVEREQNEPIWLQHTCKADESGCAFQDGPITERRQRIHQKENDHESNA